MGSLITGFSCLLVAWVGYRVVRANQRRGIAVAWKRLFIVAGVCALLMALAIGALFGAIALGWNTTGVVFFFAISIIGIVGVSYAANRLWPPTPQ